MKLLFIADGRSPIALNWISYFVERGDEVHLATLYDAKPEIPLASVTVIPVAFTQSAGVADKLPRGSLLRKLIPPGLRTRLKQRLVPRSLTHAAEQLSDLVNRLKPDLVHAMRIPYEGFVAAQGVPPAVILLVSVWGNDFTLHAPSTRDLSRLTQLTLSRADGLHTDCYRDQNLAGQWGFNLEKPAVVLPGAGGVKLDIFYPPKSLHDSSLLTVINPRGLRAYTRTDTFFKSIPKVLEVLPDAQFICPSMADESIAEKWVSSLRVQENVKLLPHVNRTEMSSAYRQSQIALSITTHDGTPNTLLEAMACGCFPIAGDLESVREWIKDGENGFLVDPNDPYGLANAILQAYSDVDLRVRAAHINLALIKERAEFSAVMNKANLFYRELLSQ